MDVVAFIEISGPMGHRIEIARGDRVLQCAFRPLQTSSHVPFNLPAALADTIRVGCHVMAGPEAGDVVAELRWRALWGAQLGRYA